MRPRLFAATLAGAAVLLIARPGVAGQSDSAAGATLGEDIRAIKRDVLLLVSTGLSELHLWRAAAAVSRSLVAAADDPFDACVAQAAVVWQTTQTLRYGTPVWSEWKTLRRLAEELERDKDATPADRVVCREAFRRVTGHFIDVETMGTSCGRISWVRYVPLLAVFAAYEAAAAR
jgi:hypothetical protein